MRCFFIIILLCSSLIPKIAYSQTTTYIQGTQLTLACDQSEIACMYFILGAIDTHKENVDYNRLKENLYNFCIEGVPGGKLMAATKKFLKNNSEPKLLAAMSASSVVLTAVTTDFPCPKT